MTVHSRFISTMGLCAMALVLALAPHSVRAQGGFTELLQRTLTRGMQAAAAQDRIEVSDDLDSPATNAVVSTGGCSGALIAPTLVLTASHCVPKDPEADTPHPACALLPTQARLAQFPWHAPYAWRTLPRNGPTIRFTNRRDQAKMKIATIAVSQPRCADMALLRLARAVPASVATPLAVMTTPPLSTDRTFGAAKMRFAGWGIPQNLKTTVLHRQTGPMRYWGANDCFIATLPPLRRNGKRIITGDSGAPLLVQRGAREIVAGIIWGKGGADYNTCGPMLPLPPQLHGMFTPTYRPQILGTDSTDIGDWLRTMAPEAEHL